MIAAASGLGAISQIPGLSVFVDLTLLTREIELYKSQLGLPEKNSNEYERMTEEMKRKTARYLFLTTIEIARLIAPYNAQAIFEEGVRLVPILGEFVKMSTSYAFTYHFLRYSLNEMKEIVMEAADNLPSSE